jgi:hypothetical protein
MPTQSPQWTLPRIVNVETRLASYPVPKIFYVGTERREVRQAVEITVQTDGPVPVRAISPVLFVGSTQVAEGEIVGENRYKFYAIEPAQLQSGAAIAFGWPGADLGVDAASALAQAVATSFRYSPGGQGGQGVA